MRGGMGRLVHALLVLAAAGFVGFLSTRWSARTDWSDAQRASLAPQSVELLQRLDAPVEVVSYASDGGPLRQGIAAFVERYRQHKPDIALTFVDPAADPAAMRQLGVSVDGEVELRHRGRSERLLRLNEREFSNALLRLSRTQERVVAFLSGNGERRPDGVANADLAQFTALLLAQGVRCVPLVLGSGARIPDNTDLLVVANPRTVVAEPVVAEIVDWVERGGALLWLVEPGENAGLNALADALSVRVLPGLLVDGSGASLGLGDPSFVVASQYPEHPITRGFALTTLFPQTVPLAQLTAPRWQVQPLLRSGAQSWSETGAMPKAGESAATIRFDADTDEMRGPLDLAFALSRLSPRPDRREQRAIVVGDGDFLSNQFLANGGNRELGQRLFNWLLADDALIEIPDQGAPDRLIRLTQTRLSLTGVSLLVGIPAALALIGLVTGWRRRRRR
ncbi:MAG TPA: GldG family protein [Tahibacter sp.]|uniref:GldG family protein n=1 Tax=Tahibacter sp. TaxID=2056211 RepID=UPI002C8BEFB6|nr:GldG family protein [Tahibacter sp.]HSX62800.1 GldG family protein [Tahibacter sp.]